MADYILTIQMPQATVDQLTQQGQSLLGFKAVLTNSPGGVPVAWFSTQAFGLNTFVNWTEEYQAYTSTTVPVAQGKIEADNPYDIDLGQTLSVNGTAGTGTVMASGTADWITISSSVSVPFTCGVSLESNGAFTPICAFPLNGNGTVSVEPIEKIFLVFATPPVETSTVVEESNSEGLLVTFTGTTSRTVTFDINGGWNWGGEAWAQIYPSGSIAAPVIVEQGGVPNG